VETIAISKFKATCMAVLERVRKTRKPILVTRFGKPVAQITPPPPLERPGSWIGSLAGKVRIIGDIISPAADESDWEALLD
jgi:prevent-host-death family protein